MGSQTYADYANNTNPRWWRDPGMRKGFLHVIILYCAVYSLGYDGALLSGLQALPTWNRDFDNPTGTSLGLIAATYYLPKIPFTFVVAWMVDRYGRKIPLYVGSVLMIAGAIAGGVAQTRAHLMGSRVLLGAGTAAAQITACALIPEIAHPRLRHFAGSFLNTTYYIGSIFAAWLTFACIYYPNQSSNGWRVPNFIQGFGPVLLLAAYFVPESPRWLIKQGRVEQAHQDLAKYHANGKMDDPLVMLEVREIKAAIELERIAGTGSWASWFKTAGNRRRFFIIIMLGTATQLSGNGVVQYFLVPVLKTVGITAPPQTAGINGGLSVFNWFVSMSGASLVERFGRRPLFLTSIIGMLVSFIMITGLAGGYNTTKVQATGVAMVPFIFFFMGFYSLAFTPLPMLYTPEISPLTMRAKSAALLLLSQNISQSFNQFVNPVALNAIGWKYYFVYIAVLCSYLALFWLFIRETKGLTTEEAAVVYEDDTVKEEAVRREKDLLDQAANALVDADSEDHDEKKEVVHDAGKRV